MNQNPSISIIGAGITGLFSAYYLAQNPKNEITLYEAGQLVHGASSKNAGFLTMGSAVFIDKLKIKHPNESDFLMEMMKNNIQEVLHISHLKSVISLGSETHGRSLIKNPYDYGIEPNELLQSLYNQLKNRVEFKFNHPIDSIDNINADHIIVATNNPPSFLAELQEVIKAQRAQIAEYEILTPIKDSPNIYIPEHRIYYRFFNNKIIIGGKRLIDPENEKTSIEEINPKIQAALFEFVTEELKLEVKLIEQRSGIMAFSDEELPFYYQRGQLHFIGGFSGHGNAFSNQMAKALASKMNHSLSDYDKKILNFFKYKA